VKWNCGGRRSAAAVPNPERLTARLAPPPHGATIAVMDHPAATPPSATPKEELRRLIDEQPEDSSYEEILRELAFAWMVERGLEDSRAGRTITHDEMRKTIESWRK
jgi:hypothetical protein